MLQPLPLHVVPGIARIEQPAQVAQQGLAQAGFVHEDRIGPLGAQMGLMVGQPVQQGGLQPVLGCGRLVLARAQRGHGVEGTGAHGLFFQEPAGRAAAKGVTGSFAFNAGSWRQAERGRERAEKI